MQNTEWERRKLRDAPNKRVDCELAGSDGESGCGVVRSDSYPLLPATVSIVTAFIVSTAAVLSIFVAAAVCPIFMSVVPSASAPAAAVITTAVTVVTAAVAVYATGSIVVSVFPSAAIFTTVVGVIAGASSITSVVVSATAIPAATIIIAVKTAAPTSTEIT